MSSSLISSRQCCCQTQQPLWLTGHLRDEWGRHILSSHEASQLKAHTYLTFSPSVLLIWSVKVKRNRSVESALMSQRINRSCSKSVLSLWVTLLLSLIWLLWRPRLREGAGVGGGWTVTSCLQHFCCQWDISGKVTAWWQSTFHFHAVSGISWRWFVFGKTVKRVDFHFCN